MNLGGILLHRREDVEGRHHNRDAADVTRVSYGAGKEPVWAHDNRCNGIVSLTGNRGTQAPHRELARAARIGRCRCRTFANPPTIITYA